MAPLTSDDFSDPGCLAPGDKVQDTSVCCCDFRHLMAERGLEVTARFVQSILPFYGACRVLLMSFLLPVDKPLSDKSVPKSESNSNDLTHEFSEILFRISYFFSAFSILLPFCSLAGE
jgi:hypothetical protein